MDYVKRGQGQLHQPTAGRSLGCKSARYTRAMASPHETAKRGRFAQSQPIAAPWRWEPLISDARNTQVRHCFAEIDFSAGTNARFNGLRSDMPPTQSPDDILQDADGRTASKKGPLARPINGQSSALPLETTSSVVSRPSNGSINAIAVVRASVRRRKGECQASKGVNDAEVVAGLLHGGFAVVGNVGVDRRAFGQRVVVAEPDLLRELGVAALLLGVACLECACTEL
jgi:hypothetical protein